MSPVAGGVAGAGWAELSTGGGVLVTMDSPPVRWPDIYANTSEVSMKTIAAPVVALLKKVEAPVLPNNVWLDPPPKAAPMSAPLPVWSSTIMISAMQTSTWIIISKIVI